MSVIKSRSHNDEPVTEEVLKRAIEKGRIRLKQTSRNQREGRYVGKCDGGHVRKRSFIGPPAAWLAFDVWSERANNVPYPSRRRRDYVDKPAIARLQAHVRARLAAP